MNSVRIGYLNLALWRLEGVRALVSLADTEGGLTALTDCLIEDIVAEIAILSDPVE
jgi:hypothetical protein